MKNFNGKFVKNCKRKLRLVVGSAPRCLAHLASGLAEPLLIKVHTKSWAKCVASSR